MTVCHLLGNGSYHLLTFDDSALKAHVGHDDIYPVPDGGCPTPEAQTPDVREGADVENATPFEDSTIVLGSEATGLEVGTLSRLVLSGTVLGAQVGAAADRTPAQVPAQGSAAGGSAAQVAPASGVLPQTGAGEIAMTTAAGLGLLAAGAGLLGRRRAQAAR